MRTAKRIKCASCEKQIYRSEPDFVLQDYDTGKVHYYHEHCGASAYAVAASHQGTWHLTHRYIEPRRINEIGDTRLHLPKEGRAWRKMSRSRLTDRPGHDEIARFICAALRYANVATDAATRRRRLEEQ